MTADRHDDGPEPDGQAPSGTGKVMKRRVFYLPGYDPIHPRRYRELYRSEGGKQAKISGYRIAQKAAQGDRFGWMVRGQTGRDVTVAKIEVLLWSDIVRSSMDTGVLGTYLALVRTVWIYLSTGAFRRLTLLGRGPVLAALYPVVALLVQLAVALGLAWAAGALVSRFVYPGAGWIVALPLVVLILRGFRRVDRRLFAYYLMHDFAYSARLRGAYPPELEARMKQFGTAIAAALASDADEVLVVGHSSGAHLAVSILADLIRAGRVPANGPALSLLTLGEVIPMLSFLPDAHRLRRDLHFLSLRDELTWVDITAPGDPCSFALCDPVAVSGVAEPDRRWPLVLSAAFSQTLSDEAQEAMRWRFFRRHFQYLCAFDRPKDYDYFQITAGPLTLAERFAGRKPSINRIDVAVSGYTSIAA
ncbi:hypothetical protein ACRDNQ_04265 [Palleronia sp. KMU-117]|uniref:hypothetical protein n=1 Tax=Palleronia sp. KMU-117 TaxID=3434108 RepID=UPI003D73436F